MYIQQISDNKFKINLDSKTYFEIIKRDIVLFKVCQINLKTILEDTLNLSEISFQDEIFFSITFKSNSLSLLKKESILFALSMYYKGESVSDIVSEIDEHSGLEDTYYRSQTEEVVFSAFKKKKNSNLINC
jgi:hypothetical protein